MKYICHSKIGFIIFTIIFSGLYSSCNKFVTVPLPQDQIQSEKVFANDQAAISSVTGLYAQMLSGTTPLTNGGMSIYAGLSADEIVNTSPSSAADPFRSNSLLPSTSVVNSSFWNPSYTNLYQANAVLEGLNNATLLTDSLKQQLKGEVKVIRSLYLFYLANFFGDVPLITSTNYKANALMPRTPTAQVYQQIISDLQDAQNVLKPSYPTSGRVRINKWAAAALLARVYLYQKDWANAETQASAVISNTATYSLVSNFSNIFLPSSSEIIWALQPTSTTYNTQEANSFVPSSVTIKPTYTLNTYLFNSFETGDQRKTAWVGTNTVSGQPYFYPSKYKIRTTPLGSEYNVVLRLAEQYLIRAEARAQQGKISDAQADLNMVRARALLTSTTATSQASLLTAILHERQVELFAEWGHRWLDLKRTGAVDSVLGLEKAPNWQITAALYPVPQSEISLNPNLIQNAGY